MNEDPGKIVPFDRFVERREEKLDEKQEIKGADIEEMQKSLADLQEELALAESYEDEERIAQLKEEIENLEDLIAKGIDYLDEVDADKKRMLERYRDYKRWEEAQ